MKLVLVLPLVLVLVLILMSVLVRWLYPFDPEQTSYSGQFWLADGATR